MTDHPATLERIAAALESIAASLAALAARTQNATPQPASSYRTVSAPRG